MQRTLIVHFHTLHAVPAPLALGSVELARYEIAFFNFALGPWLLPGLAEVAGNNGGHRQQKSDPECTYSRTQQRAQSRMGSTELIGADSICGRFRVFVPYPQGASEEIKAALGAACAGLGCLRT